MINPKIFKAYDVRAVYPDELDENGMYNIGRAYADYIEPDSVAIGMDARLSSPSLKTHLIQGLCDGGAKVFDLGVTGTEVLYYAVGKYGYDGGIMLTASHNPPKYNGLKIVKKDAEFIGLETGLDKIRYLAVNGNYKRLNSKVTVTAVDPYPDYKRSIGQFVDFDKLERLKIVVDAGNGVGGILFSKIFDNTNIEFIPMYFEPDGRFPNHHPDPLKESNVSDLKKKVVEIGADLGIALDGDGDRVFFIDNKGNFSLGYYVVAIIAKKMLTKYPGGKIIYENRNKWAIIDEVEKAGGVPVQSIAGHAFIKELMRKIDSVFGGETSSHFFYKDFYYSDSSMMTIALLLEFLSENKVSLSEALDSYRSKYYISGEINFEASNKDEIISEVKKIYTSKGYSADEMDGIAIDNGREWRFSIRKSNTEPLLRLNAEASSQEDVDMIVKEVTDFINSHKT